MKFLQKTNDRRDRRPYYAIFVVWNISYATAKTLACERARGEHLIIQLLWATVIHKFTVLSTQSMSSPSRKRGRGSSGRFHLVVFVYGVNQENKETGGVQDGGKLLHKPSPSFEKLLGRVTFRILSNINHGAYLWKHLERLKIIGLMVVVLMVFFLCVELALVLLGVVLSSGMGMEFRDKLCSIVPGKWNVGSIVSR